MLLSGRSVTNADLVTPAGIRLSLEILAAERTPTSVSCAVRKDAGDDPDITDGMLIFSRVSFRQDGNIRIDGGEGVGRVTRPGMKQPVGSAAINPVPMKMIREQVERVCEDYDCTCGLNVEIYVPGGEEIAGKTFNPRLGITGGISILGTSGIVVPMSEEALIDSIRLEMQILRSEGVRTLILTPGNTGEQFVRDTLQVKPGAEKPGAEAPGSETPGPETPESEEPGAKTPGTEKPVAETPESETPGTEKSGAVVKCSNFVGRSLDLAVELGFSGVLYAAHIGKGIKTAGGIMNTHSSEADCRMELMAAFALRAGASAACARGILESVTTEAALDLMAEEHVLEEGMRLAAAAAAEAMKRRTRGKILTGVILFGETYGELGRSEEADRLLADVSS